MMTPELWATLALALLAGAVAIRILPLARGAGPCALMVAVMRLAACLALVAALLLLTRGRGGAIGGLRWAALGLAMATLVVNVVLVWRLRADAAAPITDLVVMMLVLTACLAGQSPELGPIHHQRGISQVLWVLLLVGVGGLMVAGSTAFMLALRAALRGRAPDLAWPRWFDLHVLVKQATFLSLVALGAGLAVSLWWAWQAGETPGIGSSALAFGSSDDGLVWIAITWLIAAMSQLARRVGKRWGRWTAGLALLTAVTALVGLLMLAAPANLP